MRSKPPDTEELLHLAGLVYASVLDPSKTTDTLGALEDCFDLAGSQIFTFHRETGTILESQMCAAVHRTLSDDYLNHWGNVDPRVPMLASLSSCTAAACHHWFDDRFVSGNAYYQDFLIPAGFRWAAGGVFDAGDGATTVVAGLRATDQPHFDEPTIRLLGCLLPHMQRAGVLRQRVQHHAASAAAPPGLVGSMPMPSFIVDDRSRVVLANQAFHDGLSRLPLRLVGSWLRFELEALQHEWSVRLRNVFANRSAASLDAQLKDGGVCRMHIVPWQALAAAADGTEQRLALVMMDPLPGAHRAPDFERFCAAARLTAAERQVLGLIVQGQSAKAIARTRGASGHTVRNQIARILEKTGCRSQRELVTRLSGLAAA
jgi:DNA-binding CsgD family transcriptional regulator